METLNHKPRCRKYETKLIKNGKIKLSFCLMCQQKDGEQYKVGIGVTYNFLFAHHTKLFSRGGSLRDGGLVVTLCRNCHETAHTVDGKLAWKHVNTELASILESLYAEHLYFNTIA